MAFLMHAVSLTTMWNTALKTSMSLLLMKEKLLSLFPPSNLAKSRSHPSSFPVSLPFISKLPEHMNFFCYCSHAFFLGNSVSKTVYLRFSLRHVFVRKSSVRSFSTFISFLCACFLKFEQSP